MSRIRMSAFRLAGGLLALQCLPLAAAEFIVGPAGTYATLPLAVAAADATAGSPHEIRVQAATFTDAPAIFYSGSKSLAISGGWNAAFTSRSNNPEDTVFTIPPGGDARALILQVNSGEISIANFTGEGGFRSTDGGGLDFRAATTGRLLVQDCISRNNTGGSDFAIKGGGMDVSVAGTGHLRIARCDVYDNVLQVGTSATGGGIYLTAIDTATAVLEDNRIFGNRLSDRPDSMSPSINLGEAGLAAYAYGDSTVSVLRNRIVDNHVVATNQAFVVSQNYGVALVAGGFPAGSSGQLVARGNVIHANGTNALLGSLTHVGVSVGDDGRIDLGDSEISQGIGGQSGLQLQSNSPTSELHVTNATIADNSGSGVRANTVFPVAVAGSFFNNIVDGNTSPSPPLAEWLATGNNLIDAAPGFVARASGNYTLLPNSPAIDAGEASPPGGLGSFDAGGGARLIGEGPDIGAHEFGSLTEIADGFE